MKKILSFVLVLSLVLGSFSMAFATPADVEGTDFATPVDVLMALEVVTGYPDGSFQPEGNVTRAEMATMLVKVLGLADVAGFVGASGFGDTAGHWADKYIAVVAGQNIVNGYPDGTFKPNAPVSFPEAITMVVRALGFTDDAASITGTWPVNYIVKANNLDVTDDVSVDLAGYANRGACAQMIYNALSVTTITLDADGAEKNDVVLVTKLDAKKMNNRLITETIADDDDLTLINLDAYIFQTVDGYQLDKDDDAIIAITNVDSDTVMGEFGADEFITLDDADDTKIDVTNAAADEPVYFNGKTTALNTAVGTGTVKDHIVGYDVTVIGTEKEGDSEIFTTVDGIIAWAPTTVQFVSSDDVDEIADIFEDEKGSLFNLVPVPKDKDGDMEVDSIMVTGAVSSLKDIQKNDVVYVYTPVGYDDTYSSDTIKVEVIRDTKVITITKEKTDKVYDGAAEYKANGSAAQAIGYTSDDADTFSALEVGSTYTVWFDKAGKIYQYDKTSGDTNLYGVVIGLKEGSKDTFDDDNAEVKVFTSTGEVVTYPVDEDTELYVGYADNLWNTVGGLVIDKYDLIKYTVNSDGDINLIEVKVDSTITGIAQGTAVTDAVYIANDEYNSTTKDLDNVFFTDDKVVFDTSDSDSDKWKILTDLSDEDVVTGSAVKDGTDYEFVVAVERAAASSDNLFFAVNDLYVTKDADDDNTIAIEGFESGADKTAMADGATVVGHLNVAASLGIYQVTYKSGSLDTAVYLTAGALDVAYAEVVAADTNYVKIGSTVHEYDSKAFIYVEVYDDGEVDSYEVGDASDIKDGDKVEMMLDTDLEIELVLVTKKADIGGIR